MQARNVNLKVMYDNKDISKDIAPFLKSFDFSDAISGEADDISLTLEDREELWEGDWLPNKGAMLTVSIISQNWEKDDYPEELKLGQFELDQIDLTGTPHEVKLKAVSVPNDNSLRGEAKNRSWEKVKLSEVGKDIADGAGLELYYKAEEDKEIDRLEQNEESDLSFLMRVCKDRGLALKITDLQIIIFDEKELEQADPVATIVKSDGRLISYSVSSKTRDVYAAAHVRYDNTETGVVVEYLFKPDEAKEGKTLELHDKVADIVEAARLAKKKLREKNCEEVTVSLDMVGRFGLLAGLTVTLAGFHAFDGKYIITRTGHSIGNGYKLRADLRRCLNGY